METTDPSMNLTFPAYRCSNEDTGLNFNDLQFNTSNADLSLQEKISLSCTI